MDSTHRFSLPLLHPGQAQKETFHNEALQRLDLLVAATVEGPPSSDPPASPLHGQCYIIGADPTGAWAGHAGELAGYTAGGWRFARPTQGLTAYVVSSGTFATYRGGVWQIGTVEAERLVVAGQQVIGPRVAAISQPVGGAIVDAEARSSIGSILAALRAHGLIES